MHCLFSKTCIVQISMEHKEKHKESENEFPHQMDTLLSVGERKIRKELKSKFQIRKDIIKF